MKKILSIGVVLATLCFAAVSAHAMTQCPNMADGDIAYLVACATPAVTISALPMADIALPTGQISGFIFDILAAVLPTVLIGLIGWALNQWLGIKTDAHFNEYWKDVATQALQASKNQIQSAVPDQVVIPTQSEWVSKAAKLILETEAPKFISWLGGEDGIKKLLLAWLNVVPASEVGAALTPILQINPAAAAG